MIKLKNKISIEEYHKIVYLGEKVAIDDACLDKVDKSRAIVEDLVNHNKIIYGLTTGFGELANVSISKDQAQDLQLNLIRSHATGTGQASAYHIVRGTVLLRLVSLLEGVSGIKKENLFVLQEALNNNLYIYVPEKGSLGASGDLAPLAHIILALIGEGEILDNGKRVPSNKFLKDINFKYMNLSSKEGLALINGTPFMTANWLDAYLQAEKIMKYYDLVSAITIESLKGTATPFEPEIHEVRPHLGQINTAKNLRAILKDSPIIKSHIDCEKVQDSYSLRCIPQVHGAVKDAMSDVKKKIEIEMSSVTDNPLIFSKDKVYSQGNFHGEVIALYADFMGIAISELGSISERRIERLVNPSLSGLKPFLAEKPGLESGLMIVQYTAASVVSENKMYAHPCSVDSIPTSANQEDHVSMGANSVRKLSQICQNLWYVLSAEILSNIYAKRFREEQYSEISEHFINTITKEVDIKFTDHPFYKDIEEITNLLKDDKILSDIENKFFRFEI